jgi:hypothetical protein
MRTLLGDPSADAYLHRLVEGLRSVLDQRLVGAWVVNSGARGDYVPGGSDLDIAVGVTDALDRPTRERLADALRHASLPVPSPRLELVVYRREVLADPGRSPQFELNLNTGPAIADRVTFDAADEPPHWFVLDLAAARERSLAIAGPPLESLLGPIDEAVVLEALRASQRWHAAHDADAPNRVLNACRAWLWLVERRWSSKAEAAAWAMRAGGDAELIELALARRRGETDAPLAPARVAALTAAIDEHLRAAVSG